MIPRTVPMPVGQTLVRAVDCPRCGSAVFPRHAIEKARCKACGNVFVWSRVPRERIVT